MLDISNSRTLLAAMVKTAMAAVEEFTLVAALPWPLMVSALPTVMVLVTTYVPEARISVSPAVAAVMYV